MARHRLKLAFTAALLAVAGLAPAASAQQIVDFPTSEGTMSIRLLDNPDTAPFAAAFAQNLGRLIGTIFYKSEKSLQCTPESCECLADFDCTPCADSSAPFFDCLSGPADCSCQDPNTSPQFMCTPEEGVGFCPAPEEGTNDLFCTCVDGSTAELVCGDGSDPPGECTEDLVQTDLTMQSAALRFGLHRLDEDGQVVPIPDYLATSGANLNAPGIYRNAALTVAFVRGPSGLTSELVINVVGNSDPFDGVAGDGSDAYLVFGVVEGGQPVLDALARLPTVDLSVQVDDGGMAPEIFLSCTDIPAPAPIADWIEGIPNAIRCDADKPWDEFAVLDDTAPDPAGTMNPLPLFKGCVPGDVDCQLPLCTTAGPGGTCTVPVCPRTALFGAELRCTAALPPECLQLGTPVDDGQSGTPVPCLDPICVDTFDASGTTRCSEGPGPNFPLPEPAATVLGLVALAVVLGVGARSRGLGSQR